MPIVLFNGESLQQWLEGELQNRARSAIKGAHHDYLLKQSREQQIADFLDLARVRPVMLDAAAIVRAGWGTEVQKGRRVTVIRFSLPYSGSMRVLQLQPIEHKIGGVTVDAVYEEAIEFVVETTAVDPELVEADVQSFVGNIAWHLERANRQVEQHNARMDQLVRSELANVWKQAERAEAMVTGLRYPLIKRQDANELVAPITQRKVRPARNVGTPTWRLDDLDYEAVLQVLDSMRKIIERNPITFNKLAEQIPGRLDKVEDRFRDIFLVILNSHFTSQVLHEAFNNVGKTDILIQVEGRNVFIGECKFWDGEQSVHDAVDQLLSYQSWRDTKAGLLLFIRSNDGTVQVDKAIAAINSHTSFERLGPNSGADRHDVVLRSPNDPAQLVKVALMPFVFPAAAKPVRRRPKTGLLR